MHNDVVNLGNRLAVPQNVCLNIVTIWLSISTSRYTPRKMKTRVHAEMYTNVHDITKPQLFVIAKKWKQFKCLSTDESEKCENDGCTVVCNSLQPHGLKFLGQWDSSGKNTGEVAIPFSRGIFPTRGVEPGSPALQPDSLLSEPPGAPLLPVL